MLFKFNSCLKVPHICLLLQTSVLCKSAVHAGAAADNLGGRITVTRGRSLTLYESTFANGILSKMCVGLKMRVGNIVIETAMWLRIISETLICICGWFVEELTFQPLFLTGDHYLKRSCSSAEVRDR